MYYKEFEGRLIKMFYFCFRLTELVNLLALFQLKLLKKYLKVVFYFQIIYKESLVPNNYQLS
jgi:hypothetical protein